MIQRVFVDSDVILDVALARAPFWEASKLVLSLLENGAAVGSVSSNSITNVYYVLRKAGGDVKARLFLGQLLRYLNVVPVAHSQVLQALKSGFADFEDAIQYYCAVENRCECIVTRNLTDYQKSEIPVYLPIEFVNLHA